MIVKMAASVADQIDALVYMLVQWCYDKASVDWIVDQFG